MNILILGGNRYFGKSILKILSKKKNNIFFVNRGLKPNLKNKNIKPLSGKELIYYTIREAKKSKYIDRLIISTDCSKISSTAKKSKLGLYEQIRYRIVLLILIIKRLIKNAKKL